MVQRKMFSPEASSVVPNISGLKWPLNQLQKHPKT